MKRRQPLFSSSPKTREIVSNRVRLTIATPWLNVRSHGDRHPLWLGVSVFVPLSDETKEEERKIHTVICAYRPCNGGFACAVVSVEKVDKRRGNRYAMKGRSVECDFLNCGGHFSTHRQRLLSASAARLRVSFQLLLQAHHQVRVKQLFLFRRCLEGHRSYHKGCL